MEYNDYEIFFNSDLTLSLISDEDGTILDINNLFCSSLGYTKNEMIGKKFHIFVHPDDIKSTNKIEDNLKNDPISNKVFNFTNRYRHKSGFYMFITWRGVFDRNSRKYYTNASDDKNTDFISKISHELKTPLNAIMGYTQLTMLDDNLDGINRSNLNEIMKNSSLLLGIITDLLEISNDDFRDGKEECFVYDCISTAINQFQQSIIAKNIKLTFNAQNSNCVIGIKDVKFVQIISNLLSNAVKYNKQKGTININCNVDEGKFNIRIKDSGIGIDSSKIYRLYTPFDRLDIDANKYEGTGLGLSIVRKIINDYDGRISCVSELGVSTEFTISLKLVRELYGQDRTDIVICTDQISSQGKLKILYVEDNKMNYTLVSNILKRKFGKSVDLTISETGTDGIENIKNNSYDLILLDYMLPDINADVVLEKVIVNKYVKNLDNIILTTAVIDPIITNKLKNIGVTKFLFKPIDVAKFFIYLDECIREASGLVLPPVPMTSI